MRFDYKMVAQTWCLRTRITVSQNQKLRKLRQDFRNLGPLSKEPQCPSRTVQLSDPHDDHCNISGTGQITQIQTIFGRHIVSLLLKRKLSRKGQK